MNWPDAPSEARDAVGRHLAVMAAAGMRPEPDILATYGRAADAIADAQLAYTAARGEVEDFILVAAIGMHLHNQLILKIVALAQANQAIKRYSAKT